MSKMATFAIEKVAVALYDWAGSCSFFEERFDAVVMEEEEGVEGKKEEFKGELPLSDCLRLRILGSVMSMNEC